MNLEKVLPPGVNGKVSGHLTVKVDEVFWTKSSPGEIFVELLWWGEKDSTVFRPEDVTMNEGAKKKTSAATYSIRTSPGLFETYLRNCGKLTFTVHRGQNMNVILGSTVVNDIHQIMSENVFHAYFPIFSPKGQRIGDIHICFDLNFVLKQSHYAVKQKQEVKVGNLDTRKKTLSSKPSSATSQDDQLLSDILQKGNDLRKAMMMSVLADCPLDKIDAVMNEKTNSKISQKKNITLKQDTKLVDFLLGKDMTVADEKKAIETLRCISPDENLLSLAKNDGSKVTKSVCCLHGKKCSARSKDVHRSSSAPVPTPSISSSSYSKDQQIQDIVEEKKEEDRNNEKNLNCYRLIAKTLDLTNDGSRKIYYAPVLTETEEDLKSKRVRHPPGTKFILQISLPSKGPWPRTLKFSSKDYKEKRVKFGGWTTHRLCGSVSWARVKSQVVGSTFRVFWRHLNQRIPCPLGSATLEDFQPQPDSQSVSLSLPLYSNTRLLTAHLNLSLNLGLLTNGAGEAMFRTNEKLEEIETLTPDVEHCPSEALETDGLSSEFSAKPAVITVPSKDSLTLPSESSSNDDDDDDEIQAKFGPRKLDDELLRTINLLNSKPGDGAKASKPVQTNQGQKVEKKTQKEAWIQTTLPLTNPECPTCHRSDQPADMKRRMDGRGAAEEVRARNGRGEVEEVRARNGRGEVEEVRARNGRGEVEEVRARNGRGEVEEVRARNGRGEVEEVRARNGRGEVEEVRARNGRGEVGARAWPAVSPPEKLTRNQNPLVRTREEVVPLQQPSVKPTGARSHPMYDDYCHPHENLYHDRTLKERLRVLPEELNGTEKIHEYTIKLDKVVGVPLFTGDNDLDCYIDYSFPKVDSDGIMTYDRVNMDTVKIALRETEFGTVSKHRLRLSCKLTRALLTLPTHELVFSLWGRFYTPAPQDYRLGKATLPVTKLSSLEMKYEQQRVRQPITESFILPISVLETSLTSGYKGPFGDLHVSIGYSNASGFSYREWRCKNKDNHYWCQSHLCNTPTKLAYTEPNYECVRTQANSPPSNVNSHRVVNNSNFRTFTNSNEPKYDFIGHQYDSLRSENVSSRPLKDYNRNEPRYQFKNSCDFPSSKSGDILGTRTLPPNFDTNRYITGDIRQTNLQEYLTDRQYVRGLPNGAQNENIPTQRMPPIGESTDPNSHRTNTNPSLANNINGATLESILGPGKRENIVKKVLKDIQERKLREKILANSLHKGNSKNEGNATIKENNDAFNSFNFGTDLPNDGDSSEFEVRSQYSFLKTPEPSFPVNNCIDLESSSSNSIKQRLFEENSINPFSSRSNISIGSNSSLFEPAEKDGEKNTNENNLKTIPSDSGKSTEINVSSRKKLPTKYVCEHKSGDSEKENSDTSNGTLKSVESLKSFKEVLPVSLAKDIPVTSGKERILTVGNVPQTSQKQFKARVEICRALGLPSLEVKQADGKIGLVKPTSHAYFTAFTKGKESSLQTRVIENKSNPVWDSSWEVHLPVELLKKSERELEIFVDVSGDGDGSTVRMSDVSQHWPIVLRTGVDLTPITAGLDHASGWYSLSDRALMSRAQIKVIVTPLEDVSGYREEWLKEYTKSKGKRLPQGEKSTTLAASLQEKLFELEKLTQRMKNKMAARSEWDESPPLSLLAEVREQSLGPSVGITGLRERPLSKSTNLPSGNLNENSAIVISDDSGDDSDDRGSYEVVNTYTVSEGSGPGRRSENEDSLETSSQAIDRIITKVRENR